MASIGSIHAEQQKRLYQSLCDEIACAVLTVRERHGVGYTRAIQEHEDMLALVMLRHIETKREAR